MKEGKEERTKETERDREGEKKEKLDSYGRGIFNSY